MDLIRSPKNGDSLDASLTMYPCRLEVVSGERRVGTPTSTTFGYVLAGQARVRTPGLEVRADAGAFFCFPGEVQIETPGLVVAIEKYGFRGVPMAGRIEERGRLSYIDGCSDTILVSPPRRGDPVFNHLHFPRGVDQTPHTHPSIRLGMVARGQGIAYQEGAWEHELTEGAIFLLHAHELHSFRTTESAKQMDVIAFHPDSDWGPTDGVHPMLNRTYLNNQPPARQRQLR